MLLVFFNSRWKPMKTIFCLAILATTCLPSWAAPVNKGGPSHKGWIVSQESSSGGVINIFISDDAIRIDSQTCGFSMLATAPDWKVCIFRPDTKEMGFLKLSQWRAWNTSTIGTTNLCTLDKPISRTVFRDGGTNTQAYQYKFPGEKICSRIFQTDKPVEMSNYFVDSYQLSKSPQVTALQCQFFNCPKLDGIIVKCIGVVKGTGEKQLFIRTRKIQASDSIPASTFAVPKGYKLLKTINNQFKFKGMAGALDEFGEMLDLGKARSVKQQRPN